MNLAIRFLANLLWRWEVVSLASVTLYGFGVGAMYADDYFIAALLYFAGTAYLTAKCLAWEEVTEHGARKGISVLILVAGIIVFGLSLGWINHRSRQIEAAKKNESEAVMAIWHAAPPKPPSFAFEKSSKAVESLGRTKKKFSESQWREKMAAASEGDLIGAGEVPHDGLQRAYPIVQIADTGSNFLKLPEAKKEEPYFNQFPDAKFWVEYGMRGPMVSTTIRDADGHIVVTVDQNHWRVFPQFCPDKNYTEYALEVFDNSLHVVLQLNILPNSVQVQGEWWDNQGNGMRILKAPNDPDQGGIIAYLGSKNKKNDLLIKPMFRYPSSRHLGEFVK